MQNTTITFVYNADSGLFNALSDIAHKTFSPENYSCNLCAITYGTFGMRAEWKQFLESLEIGLEFLHRNELAEQYGIVDAALPAIFLKQADAIELWIAADEINACADMAELKQLIVEKLSNIRNRIVTVP